VVAEDDENVKEKGEGEAVNGGDEQGLHVRTGCMRGKDGRIYSILSLIPTVCQDLPPMLACAGI
jgi:hypothetical protein